MSQDLQDRYVRSASQDPDTSLPLDPTAINSTGLDLDPEASLQDPTAVVTRTRRPQVKLTAEKLCSAKGLPLIMKSAPKRVRISKRRSSYDNLCHILQFYQLWAHELFPKAKFNDFVAICRTLGKSDPQLRAYRIDLLRRELGMSTEFEYPGTETQDPETTTPASDLPPISKPPAHIPHANDLPSEPPSPRPENSDSDDDLIYSISRRTPRNIIQESEPDDDDSMLPTATHEPAINPDDDNDDDEDEDELAVMREMGL